MDIPPLVALSRLYRRWVRCTDQAECDRIGTEIAELEATLAREADPNERLHLRHHRAA
jgi:hypothetical protein